MEKKLADYVETLNNWMTNLWTIQLMGTFYNTNLWFTNLSLKNFRVDKFVTPVVWIVLHSPKFVNPTSKVDNQTFAQMFLEYLEEECWFLYDFWENLKIRNGTFTWDTVDMQKIEDAHQGAFTWLQYCWCLYPLNEAAKWLFKERCSAASYITY